MAAAKKKRSKAKKQAKVGAKPMRNEKVARSRPPSKSKRVRRSTTAVKKISSASSAGIPVSSPVRKHKLMIVEDIDSMRQFLKLVLEESGEVVVQSMAANIWEARMELERRRPDLVLLDEVLPGESSLDFLKELVTRKIPALLLTGMENPTHEIPPGAGGRLMKPGWKSPDPERALLLEAIRKSLSK
ncbi:MAG: response regulator [Bacteriovoracia bacterium]